MGRLCVVEAALHIDFTMQVHAMVAHLGHCGPRVWHIAGSITPKPQPGNPKPRMFRLPEFK